MSKSRLDEIAAKHLSVEFDTAILPMEDLGWLIEKLRTAVKALEFYAKRTEHSPLGGDTAREALQKIRGKE